MGEAKPVKASAVTQAAVLSRGTARRRFVREGQGDLQQLSVERLQLKVDDQRWALQRGRRPDRFGGDEIPGTPVL